MNGKATMEYERIEVTLLSDEAHLSQILTGFCLLERSNRNLNVKFAKDYEREKRNPFSGPFLLVNYRGKRIVYDMLDGYNMPEAIQYHLDHCDYYFKRSYSEQKNQDLGLASTEKMLPLGFNYHVSCKRHPLDKPEWKERIKGLLGIECNRWSSTYFSWEKFEEIPEFKEKNIKVLFSARLWGEPELDRMRIEIMRALKENKAIEFIGGITDSPLAQSLAPDLVVSREFTDRSNYLKLLHSSDICIASTGLHESIGWKMGEYIAGAKAIVSEKLCYQVPGNYTQGNHYLEFSTVEECLNAIQSLLADPQKLFAMKQANRMYYQSCLRPDVLVKNSLDVVAKYM